ncbi:sulfurtransferase [Paenibacillus eucommiae]|uniref:Thiosulfate/3-mercaptopyruvate sulfurtransferase n=1 Tax=Paenibacillus eucommiae TaxID=1355755 RepID=A0ABS4J9J9_9BACL|nr:sulfurtransferase [Paenibacillus eucommiae]MBP1996533.1 thiosulfate/3-mercaptopyruvate sulfurtransferase [Paenibacillus eucommiae]
MPSSNIVDTTWVQTQLQAGANLAIADVRFSPKEASYGRNAYDHGHLPGAVFVDFKADLTDPAREHGGRSPLPEQERLAGIFGGLGIDLDTPVVVYEDVNGPAAARLWWVLKYLGHEQVYVLDGGYSAWTAAGLPVTTEVPEPVSKTFNPILKPELLVGIEEVRSATKNEETVLIDSRDANQYLGLEAPFDPIAGHIPSAVNFFWKDSLTETGNWKSAEELREQFSGVDPSQEIIVYCGSGISATPNVLALEEAGFRNVKLYGGSWSDWISYPENPIATGKE